jgi:hypothetical protein
LSNNCSNPKCKDRGQIQEDCGNGTVRCNTCKSRSCSIKDKPAYWYHCISCHEFGVYTDSIPKKCGYCQSTRVTC